MSDGIPFPVIGIAFIAIGAGGQRALPAIGLVFIVLGIVLARQRRVGG